MDNLFKSFSQVDSSTTRKYGGTGLGLAISKNLVEQMGGEVSVSSVLNEGSEFKFNLKLELSDLNDKIEEEHVEPVIEDDQFFRLSVLVAEDNLINQQVIAMLLKNMGVQTKIVNNGIEVLNAVRNEQFDVIFMDIQMPEMDGLEATQLLLSKEEFVGRTPPIIAMTANAMLDDQYKCREVGMVGFVSKPINLNELKRVLKSIEEDKLK
jgi:CheY-like chemotaxis protein